MENSGEMKPINNVTFGVLGNKYVLNKGGGSITPGVPIPENTVDSNSIKDGSIKLEDLAPELREGLDELNNIGLEDEDIDEIFDSPSSGGGGGQTDDFATVEECEDIIDQLE